MRLLCGELPLRGELLLQARNLPIEARNLPIEARNLPLQRLLGLERCRVVRGNLFKNNYSAEM